MSGQGGAPPPPSPPPPPPPPTGGLPDGRDQGIAPGAVAGSIQERPFDGQTATMAAGPRPSVQRQSEGRKRLEGASEIRLDRIVRDPTQPREEFDEAEL